jgi:L-threonylcarbamoyladenylate synthase
LKTLVLSLDDLEKDLEMRSKTFLKVAKIINRGGVIVFPTDTVYGIGGNPLDESVIQKILKIKNRIPQKRLPILIDQLESLAEYARVSPKIVEILKRTWPGPVSFILPKTPRLSEKLTGGRSSIAVRMPNHSLLLDLISHVGGAMIATSANISGRKPLSHMRDLINQFENKVDVILTQTNLPLETPSSVIDLTGETPNILRVGSVQIPWLNGYKLV